MRSIFLILMLVSIDTYTFSQNCKCLDYEFSSSKDKPVIEIGTGNNQLIVCGYSNVDLGNGLKSGFLQKDSSIYMSGFNAFTCTDSIRPLISFGEVKIFKIKRYNDYLTLDLMMNLPVDKGLNYKNTPLLRYKISKPKGKWTIGKPIRVLDLSALTSNDFFKIKKDLGWDKLYPEQIFKRDENYQENKIMYAFIVTLKDFPKYNQKFKDLGTFDGYLAELHNEFERILTELK
jgi:hypothetical protein